MLHPPSRLQHWLRPLSLLVMLTLMSSGVAAQSDRDDATMTTRAYRPIPDNARVALQIADDSDINLRLQEVTSRALTRASYTVVTDKPTITLRLETVRRTAGSRTDDSIGSIRAGSSVGRPTGNVGGPQGTGVDLNVKLWSSTKNSLLRHRSSGSVPKQGFDVKLEAFDETTLKPAWNGIARAAYNGGDNFRAGSIMINRLIGHLRSRSSQNRSLCNKA